MAVSGGKPKMRLQDEASTIPRAVKSRSFICRDSLIVSPEHLDRSVPCAGALGGATIGGRVGLVRSGRGWWR